MKPKTSKEFRIYKIAYEQGYFDAQVEMAEYMRKTHAYVKPKAKK